MDIWNRKHKAKQTCKRSLVSFMAMLIVLLQPVFAAGMVKDESTRIRLVVIYAIGITLFVGYFLLSEGSAGFKMFKSYKGDNGHFVWEWLNKPNWLMVIWYLTFFMLGVYLSGHMGLLLLMLITIVASLFFYYKYETWGTMWCWTANIIGLVLICKILFYDAICR